MKHSRITVGLIAALLAIAIGGPQLRAQDQTGGTGSATDMNASSKIEDLQKELDALKAQIDQLKKEQETKKAAAAAPATASSAATAAPAAATPPTTAAIAAPASPTPTSGPTWYPFTPVSGIYMGSSDPDLGELTGIKLFNGVHFRGWADGYFDYNFNNPDNSVVNALQAITAIRAPDATIQGRTFDVHSDNFTLDLAELEMEKIPSRGGVGFKFDLAFGDTQNIYNDTIVAASGSNSLSEFDKTFQQASISYLAPVGKGLRLDFGKFVTHIGGETIESIKNANFSHSFFYTYAIPFQDSGLRIHYDFNSKLYMEGYVLNGWNVVFDINRGKTFGYTVSYTPGPHFSVVANWLGGPEQPDNDTNWRNLGDFQVYINPTPKFRTMTNIDVAHESQAIATGIRQHPHANASWDGVAEVLRYRLTDRFDPSLRVEWYRDPQGFTTGVPQNLMGYTLTLDYFLRKEIGGGHSNILLRPELRYDHSTADFFSVGSTPGLTRCFQPTVGLDVVYFFD